jgi:hypothetical protein
MWKEHDRRMPAENVPPVKEPPQKDPPQDDPPPMEAPLKEPTDAHIGDRLRPSRDQDARPWFGSDDDAPAGNPASETTDPQYLRRPRQPDKK